MTTTNKTTINLSLPVKLSTFREESGNTIASLKVFYKGETVDGRLFSEEFSEQLKESLPYTPVVAYYDTETKDFKGHNQTQYIYGLVRGDAKYEFEKDESGTEWLITEVMLYTDRVDNIGEVASKIVGHKQSLEIDPKTVKYEFIKVDGKRKVKFTEGKLAGLSVLGTNENPAFEGSEFFKAAPDTLQNLKERFGIFFSLLEQRGVQNMGNTNPNFDARSAVEQYIQFATRSYTAAMQKMQSLLEEYYKNDAMSVYVIDMGDNVVVYYAYDWNDGSEKFYRVSYQRDEEDKLTINMEGKTQVFRIFASEEEIARIEEFTSNEADKPEAEGEEGDNESGADATAQPAEEGASELDKPDESDAATAELAQQLAEITANSLEQAATIEQLNAQLSKLQSQITEYEELEKTALIASYEGILSEEVLSSFDLAKHTKQELEIALALKFVEYNKGKRPDRPLAFTVATPDNTPKTTSNTTADLVARYKDK